MQANIKIANGKQLKVKTLIDSGYTHTGIDKQLVKDKRIQMKLINFSFKVYNVDRTKNREVTRIAPLEVEINRHKEHLKAAVTDFNSIDIFLEYDWLVKYNLEVNWKNSKINFTRCLDSCRIKHHKAPRYQIQDTKNIGKENIEQEQIEYK